MSKRAKPFSKKYQKEWSETYKYKHLHTGEYCTFEAYVAEYLILRWTEAFKMDKPSYKFWTVGDKYHEAFIRNMKATKSLAKKFDEEIILGAIKSKYFEKIYHIGLKCYGPRGWKYNQLALQAITEYNREIKDSEKLQQKIATQQPNIEIVEQQEEKIRRTTSYNTNKSVLNKLRNL